ncbi:MAG: response regulator transcription factor [Spirochaetia bacterium]
MAITGKLLIVDDEPINLDFFDIMLSKLGFDVHRAEDGEEALEKVQDIEPDLIILDNIMPKLTGWEVTKILKQDTEYEEFSNIPIIMFSAMDDVKDKVEGFELGIEDYITKPFNFSEVLARIRAVLRSHELSKQVVHRERRLAVLESLNKSLIYFTEHLKQPVVDLLNNAKGLDTSSETDVEGFVALVRDECENTLAALQGLEDEIQDLRDKSTRLEEGEISLQDLEDKFQQNFKRWNQERQNVDEVTP